MVVNLTPNIGLSKPTATELAENWVNFSNLQGANNSIIIDKMDVNLTSYTPTIIGATSNPNLGAGNIRGEYYDFQGIISGSFVVEFTNPGISVGSGEYGIKLPFTVDNTYHTVGTALPASGGNVTGALSVIGEGYAYDSSNATASGEFVLDVVTIAGVSYARMVTAIYTVPAKTSSVISAGQIFVPDDGDKFVGSFIYKRT